MNILNFLQNNNFKFKKLLFYIFIIIIIYFHSYLQFIFKLSIKELRVHEFLEKYILREKNLDKKRN